MALVKVKPTSPGRRAVVKVVSRDLHKGAPYARLVEKQNHSAGRNNNGQITTRHMGGGHKQHYRIVDFRRNKDGVAAKVERASSAPLLCGWRASLYYCTQRRQRRDAIDERGGRADQKRKCVAITQYSCGQHDSLRGNDARQGSAACSLGRNIGAAACTGG